MSNIEPRKPRRLSREERVNRGANLVIAAGVSAGVCVIATLLAFFGVLGGGIPLVAFIATLIFAFGAYRTIR